MFYSRQAEGAAWRR